MAEKTKAEMIEEHNAAFREWLESPRGAFFGEIIAAEKANQAYPFPSVEKKRNARRPPADATLIAAYEQQVASLFAKLANDLGEDEALRIFATVRPKKRPGRRLTAPVVIKAALLLDVFGFWKNLHPTEGDRQFAKTFLVEILHREATESRIRTIKKRLSDARKYEHRFIEATTAKN